MTTKHLFALIAATLTVGAAEAHSHTTPAPSPVHSCGVFAAAVDILTDRPCQQIDHFGASDAWTMQSLGLWDNDSVVSQTADWLFSTELDANGQPRGIGLSLWRFNLGAGSAEQGRAAQINRGTRTECLMRPDGTWDMTRQAGQQRFLRLAKERGVPHFLAFLNSPPVYYTQNGLATNTGRDGTLNLKADCYGDFAQFIATAIDSLQLRLGLHFDYVSPLNEPDGSWNWLGPKQEGTPATNRETARIVRHLSEALTQRGLDTEIIVNESSDLRCLMGIHETSWERGNTLRTLFSPDSTETCISTIPHLLPVIAAHSYWTNTPVNRMRRIREQLREQCRQLGIGYWQSELCIMQNDEEIGGGQGYDFTMKTALYVARVIHHDLVYGDARSWSWWRAGGGDYRDGLLRVYDRERRVAPSRLLWAMGNYSRFVRPGATRYEVRADNSPTGLMTSAFRNADGRWVIVAINYADEPITIAPTLTTSSGSQQKTCRWQPYRTSDVPGETLAPITEAETTILLPPRSITTLCER